MSVSTSVKGVKTFDCTAEITYTGDTTEDMSRLDGKAETLAASDALVAALEERYPVKAD